jgi:uncharacterized protein
MTLVQNKIIIENIGKKPILADVSFCEKSTNKPIVIFCHGYKGYKDWGAWNLVAQDFANSGFVFLKFNFSHNGGTIENPIDFPDLKAFGENTYSKEVEDLKRILDYCEQHFENQKIILIGHSRGGGIVSLVAGQVRRVSQVVTWAGVSDFKSRFPQGDELLEWKNKGVRYILNGRTHQQMPHYFSFHEDFIANESMLTIEKWVKKIEIPHLIVHGANDETVSIEEAEKLQRWNPQAVLFTLDTNHTFDTFHPYSSKQLPEKLKEVVKFTMEFCKSRINV